MSKSEMDGAIDFLTSEGHIYSTIDDEHFKTIDAEYPPPPPPFYHW